MERKRAYNFYVLKDKDLQSPDSKKDISLDEGGIVQAEPTGIRRNLTKVFEGDDDSSGDDSIVEILSEDEARAEEYYDEAERLPIYKRVSVGLSSLELVQIIVGQEFHLKNVCKVKPVAVHHNVTFVIDLNHVALKDLGADDNGAWEISCPKQRFRILIKISQATQTTPRSDQRGGAGIQIISQRSLL